MTGPSWVVMAVTVLLTVRAGDSKTGSREPQQVDQNQEQQREEGQLPEWDLVNLSEKVSALERGIQELRTSLASTRTMVRPQDCADVYHQWNSVSGVYEIQPNPFHRALLNVSCMFDDEGLWTVIQRRVDGSTDFSRDWAQYRDGFGESGPTSNFWLGLEHMHQLTAQRRYTVRFDIMNWEGRWYHTEYTGFNITDERDAYRLYWSDISKKSTAGDGLQTVRGHLHEYGMAFSTQDADHDGSPSLNCAEMMHGGWWYNWCGLAYLNGKFHTKKERFTNHGIRWGAMKHTYSFAQTLIRMKPTGLY